MGARVIPFEEGRAAVQERARARCKAMAARPQKGEADTRAALIREVAQGLAKNDFKCPCGARKFFPRAEGLRCSGCARNTPWEAVLAVLKIARR